MTTVQYIAGVRLYGFASYLQSTVRTVDRVKTVFSYFPSAGVKILIRLPDFYSSGKIQFWWPSSVSLSCVLQLELKTKNLTEYCNISAFSDPFAAEIVFWFVIFFLIVRLTVVSHSIWFGRLLLHFPDVE